MGWRNPSLSVLPHTKAGGCVRRRGRAENPGKSEGPHRSRKLMGLSEETEVQRGDCDSMKVTRLAGWLAAQVDMGPTSGSGLNYSPKCVSRNRMGHKGE